MEKFIVTVDSNGQVVHHEPYTETQVVDPFADSRPDSWEWSGYATTGGVLLGVIILLFSMAFIVHQQTVTIIERFGRFKKVANAGLNFKIPFIDRKAGTLSLKVQEIEKSVDVKSKDNAFLEVPVKVQFQVLADSVHDAFYRLEDPVQQILSYIVNIVRSEATTMEMEDIFNSKDKFEAAVAVVLSAKFTQFGYHIANVLVDDPQPSGEVVTAFNRVIASKREREAAQNEADAIRVKTVGVAQAEGESLEIKATAYVNQRKIIAAGLREAIEIIGKDNSKIDDERILAYLEGIDWRDTVRDASNSQGSVIMIPAEMGSSMKNLVAMNEALKK